MKKPFKNPYSFPPLSEKQWKQKIQYELQGEDYNEKMVWESPEGIKVKPFYHLDSRTQNLPDAKEKRLNWNIAANIYWKDSAPSSISKKQKHGVNSFILHLEEGELSIDELLASDTNLFLQGSLTSFETLLKDASKFKRNTSSFSILLDPISQLVQTGNWFENQDKDIAKTIRLATAFKEIGIKNTIRIDATIYQNAGANIVQELAYTTAHAFEYLQQIDPKLVEFPIFKIAIGGNYFFEIAKLRAIRILWALIAKEYKLSADCHIIAQPSRRNKTLYGHHNNMVRTSLEHLAAINGGANTICPQPYDFLFRSKNDYSEDLAINQLLMLQHESYLNEVSPPANGTYYLESLTEQLSQKALQLFKQIEAGGGLIKQLVTGTLQRKIKESVQKQQRLFDQKEHILVGSNEFMDTTELMFDKMKINPFRNSNPRKTLVEPLLPIRLAEKWELSKLKQEGWKPSF
ncbi:methylmalonyl-CoA mutase family protein [Euzebyella saccharophila]|uniref:Methylmalonyl-CoA mutase family protein n=1 Tax=Euzebyella saccharophila TaxID=679664 RepID=A0ABV8JYR6_9FLAO|nr:methylmalonyl-CoA mutase family protein [Euzebyella saccharophila]